MNQESVGHPLIKRGRKRLAPHLRELLPSNSQKEGTMKNLRSEKLNSTSSTIVSNIEFGIIDRQGAEDDEWLRKNELIAQESLKRKRRRKSKNIDVIPEVMPLHVSPARKSDESLYVQKERSNEVSNIQAEKSSESTANISKEALNIKTKKKSTDEALKSRTEETNETSILKKATKSNEPTNIPAKEAMKNIITETATALAGKTDKIVKQEVEPLQKCDYSKILKNCAAASTTDVDSELLVDGNETSKPTFSSEADYTEVLRLNCGPSSRTGTFMEKGTGSVDVDENTAKSFPLHSTKRKLSYALRGVNFDSSPTFSNIVSSTPMARAFLPTDAAFKMQNDTESLRRTSKRVSFGKEYNTRNSVKSPKLSSVHVEDVDVIEASDQATDEGKRLGRSLNEKSKKNQRNSSKLTTETRNMSTADSSDFEPGEDNVSQKKKRLKRIRLIDSTCANSSNESGSGTADTSIKHYADVTGEQFARETKCKKRAVKNKSVLYQSYLDPPSIIEPDPTQFPAGCRRSMRRRMPVLHPARYVHYKPVGNGTYEIDYISKLKVVDRVALRQGRLVPLPNCVLAQRRKALGGQKKVSQLNKTARNLSIHVKNVDDISHDDDESTKVKVFDPASGKEKFKDCITVKTRLAFFNDDGEPAAENDKFAFTEALKTDRFTQGHVVIRPLETMKEKAAKLITFSISFGKLMVTIHQTERYLQSGDLFLVPEGNEYSIKNLRRDEAKLVYTRFH